LMRGTISEMSNELGEPIRLVRYDLDADHPVWLAPDFHGELTIRTTDDQVFVLEV
jgi:hypothetical protein